jgi:hypothetical protein
LTVLGVRVFELKAMEIDRRLAGKEFRDQMRA